MIEQGLVMLVQANAAVLALCPKGGFNSQLPKDFSQYPTWTYKVVSDPGNYLLKQPETVGQCRIQIDCYAVTTAADTIKLAKAIDSVLNGYRGTLPDPEATKIQGCFRENKIDFFDTDSRTFRRMLEYMIWSNP